jgi:hypothetical protein
MSAAGPPPPPPTSIVGVATAFLAATLAAVTKFGDQVDLVTLEDDDNKAADPEIVAGLADNTTSPSIVIPRAFKTLTFDGDHGDSFCNCDTISEQECPHCGLRVCTYCAPPRYFKYVTAATTTTTTTDNTDDNERPVKRRRRDDDDDDDDDDDSDDFNNIQCVECSDDSPYFTSVYDLLYAHNIPYTAKQLADLPDEDIRVFDAGPSLDESSEAVGLIARALNAIANAPYIHVEEEEEQHPEPVVSAPAAAEFNSQFFIECVVGSVFLSRRPDLSGMAAVRYQFMNGLSGYLDRCYPHHHVLPHDFNNLDRADHPVVTNAIEYYEAVAAAVEAEATGGQQPSSFPDTDMVVDSSGQGPTPLHCALAIAIITRAQALIADISQ